MNHVLIFLFTVCLLLPGKNRMAQDVVTINENFESGRASGWIPKNPAIWDVVPGEGNNTYSLLKPGIIPEDVRRPGAYSVLKEKIFTDVSFSLDARCERPDSVRGRDVIIIIGYRDDYHFYYCHLSNINDPVHNNILIVNGSQRTPLRTGVRIARLTDSDFHRVRVYRNVESGLIAVYVDDMDFFVLSAVDIIFGWGAVGMGSFDDWGSFDNIVIKGILRN